MKRDMNHLLALVPCVFIFLSDASAQKVLARIEVQVSDNQMAVPVNTNLDAITTVDHASLSLMEVQGKKRISIPVQIEKRQGQRQMHWMVQPNGLDVKNRIFELASRKNDLPVSSMLASRNDAAIVIKADGKNLLQYNFKTVYPPAGVDSAYRRSAFIHPLWSPQGQVLTRIQPPDHYHHYGIWNPWTHILFEGDTLDLWNLNKKEGTVRFADFTSVNEGPVFAEYSALHEHVALKSNKENVILNEVQSVRIYKPDENHYAADISIRMQCATPSPVLILAYRYAGLGWRTTEQWTKDNSEVLTSEGKTRKDADGSRARWCLVQGLTDNVNAGVLMMSSPENYSHPEPLRIWPENQYDRGDMFANFNPTKERDWLLEPGKTYVLRYRFIVFNGPFTREKAEQAWQHFATSPQITIKKL
jgi:hypothetical protein